MNLSRFPASNLDMIAVGLLTVAEGLAAILSLGFWWPNLVMRYLCLSFRYDLPKE